MITKERQGVVVSNRAEKTITVVTQRRVSHKKFKKVVSINKNFLVHDPENICQIGDRVKISETKPISKEKRWQIKSIISKSSKINLN